MGEVKGAGGPSGAQATGTCPPQENVTTVKTGETTLRQVGQRLVPSVSEDALRKANPQIKNPNQLQAGMDICLPEKADSAPASNSQGTKTTPEKKPQSGGTGFKIPKGRVGDYEIPLPKPTTKTTDVYDGGGTDSSRRAEQERLDSTRPRDERDLDPKVVEAEKKKKTEQGAKIVDRELQKGLEDTPDGRKNKAIDKSIQQEKMDEFYRQQRQRFGGINKNQK